LGADKGVPQSGWLAKYTAAFFNGSRSSVTRFSFFFSCRISFSAESGPNCFFQTGDFETLALFYGFKKLPRFHQRLMSAGVKPGKAWSQHCHLKTVGNQLGAIHIGDFQFTKGGGFYALCDIRHLIVVKVKAGNDIMRFGFGWLLFDAYSPARLIKLYNGITLWAGNPVTRHRGPIVL
jgi:hypothetical protein